MENAKNNLRVNETNSEVSNQEKAFLIYGTDKVPIHTEITSKYSLSFRYLSQRRYKQPDEHVRLLINNNGDSVELGPCRILSDDKINGYGGRLVFTNKVYDFEFLLGKNKILKFQTPFSDLIHILARKNAIRSSFKEYTTDLTYDLNTYKNLFDEMDAQIRDEPAEVRGSVQKAIIQTEGRKFIQYLNDRLLELEQLVADFSVKEHQLHGYYFRKQIWNFIKCSAFMTRTNLKPRGYAGDSEMMRMVYLNDYQGDSTFEKLMHKYPIDQPGAQSVRHRRKIIRNMLRKVENKLTISEGQALGVLSVACGPAFEVCDILVSPGNFKKYHFTLLDQDQLALDEASKSIHEVEKKLDTRAQIKYVQASVRLLITNKSFKKNLGKFSFIYSMGLFDYLSPRVAKVVLENLYQLLNPEGRMIIGNFHSSNQNKYFLDYWLDWNLCHRTEKEFMDLIKDLPSAEASIFFDDTGNQMFLNLKR
ncbi:MAG: class I SAM-dependent methyltransferase family protein [Nitrospinales bacterium]